MNLSLAHSLYRYARLKFNNALIRVLFRNKQPRKKYFLAVCAIFKNEGKFFTEQFFVCGDFMSYKSFLNTKFVGWLSKKNKSPHFWRFKFFGRVCAEDPLYYSELTKKPRHIHAQINHYYCKSYEYFYNKKIKNGSLSEKINLSMKNFFDVDALADHADYRIYKYQVELKTFNLDDFVKTKEAVYAS